MHSFIGLRSPEALRANNVMKHSVSKNNDLNEDEVSIA
jgi:hypothetical protein